MSYSTQLALPGSYINLQSNVIAPQLKAELKSDTTIIHVPQSLLGVNAFDEDEYTSKVGGVPCWLPPSVQSGNYVPPSIPQCKHCNKTMVLLTQLYAPYDFSTDGISVPLPSFCASSLGQRTRHARVIYVFGCLEGKCSNLPGTWCVLSACQSEGVEVTEESSNGGNKYDDDDDDDYDVSSDEEGENTCNPEIVRDIVKPLAQLSLAEKKDKPEPVKPATSSTTTASTSKPAKKQDLFDVGGWSDDDEEEEEKEPEAPTSTITNTEEEVSEAALEKAAMLPEEIEKAADANVIICEEDASFLSNLLSKRDEEQKKRQEKLLELEEQKKLLELEKRKKQSELDKLASKTNIVVQDQKTTVTALRPFYLCWEDEPKTVKPNLEKEEAMLSKYIDEFGDILNTDSSSSGTSTSKQQHDLNFDDEYEETQDKPFLRFMNRIERLPEQCIRYYPKLKLQLHATPSDNTIENIRKHTETHPLEIYNKQNGLWLIHHIPECEYCGTPMQLELQILPNLLTELHLDDEDDFVTKKLGKKYFDWGIIDVYTCPLVCVTDEYVTNYCAIHPSL